MAQHIKNVVLVHGAFADGSGWEDVANILNKDGYTVAVVQHPETSYAGREIHEGGDRQTVRTGGSGGPQLRRGRHCEAGNHPKVVALVYIAAFALDTGESCAAIEQAVPPATTGIKSTDDGHFYIDPAVFHADFAADLPEAKAAFMAESQVLISADSFTHKVTSPARRTKPTC